MLNINLNWNWLIGVNILGKFQKLRVLASIDQYVRRARNGHLRESWQALKCKQDKNWVTLTH